jgi:hypothetical protein
MTSKPLSSGKGAAAGTSTGWSNPAWAGVTGQGNTYKKATLPTLKPDTNYVNPAWAGYIDAAKKGKSYQQVHADAVPTYGSGAYVQAYLERQKQVKPSSKTTTSTTSDTSVIYTTPNQMKFNLPPHQWSLPINPANLNTSNYVNSNSVDHSKRRAIMWYYGGADTTDAGILLGANTAGSTASQTAVGDVYKTTPQDNYWGFQFLWNPQAFQTVLTRNSNVVPSLLDKHASLNGLFTAMESIQFTITIDRVNDFAFLKGLFSYYSTTASSLNITKNILSDIASKYYTNGYPSTPNPKEDPADQLKDLMTMGTMADVEYIYKMINGSGQKGKVWANGLGRQTADLAFLSPTAIALKLGPNPDSLSYVGWIESLNVNHTMFTEDMIPIHTEVTVTFNGFSRVALTSKN